MCGRDEPVYYVLDTRAGENDLHQYGRFESANTHYQRLLYEGADKRDVKLLADINTFPQW